MYLDENGMWLIFDDYILTSKYQLSTINTIHIFSKNKNIKYTLNIKPDLKWVRPYNNIIRYNTNYIDNLNNLLKMNTPITYIKFNEYNVSTSVDIITKCIKYIVSNMIIHYTSKNKIGKISYIKKIKTLLNNKKITFKLNKTESKITIISNPNCKSKIVDKYNISKKCCKVYNIRQGSSWLWHYYHFINDCINIEFNKLKKYKQQYIIRLNQPDQSIGTFKTIYETIMNKKNKEISYNKYKNLYCKTKVIHSLEVGHKPFPNNHFKNLYSYCIHNFYLHNYPKYDIILIERKKQSLAFTNKTPSNIYKLYNKKSIT